MCDPYSFAPHSVHVVKGLLQYDYAMFTQCYKCWNSSHPTLYIAVCIVLHSHDDNGLEDQLSPSCYSTKAVFYNQWLVVPCVLSIFTTVKW